MNRRLVLVVDDDPAVRSMIREALLTEGLEVEVASDGREAIARALRHRPDLVVLDLTLPFLDGEEVAQRLCAVYGAGSVPILVISATDWGLAEKARRAGAFAYLHKPFELEDLLDTVARGMSRRRPLAPA